MKRMKPQTQKVLPEEESQLLRGCIQKEKAAWDEFVERYSSLIYYCIHQCLRKYSFSAQPEDVEDLFHTVFHVLLEDNCKKLRQFKKRCSLASWIRVITTRIVIDWLRKERPSVPLDAEDKDGGSFHDKLSDTDTDIEERIYEEQRRKLLKQALKQTTPEDRLLAVLVYQREMSVEEIAAAMNISKEAVYTRKHRLKEKLQDTIEKGQLL